MNIVQLNVGLVLVKSQLLYGQKISQSLNKFKYLLQCGKQPNIC